MTKLCRRCQREGIRQIPFERCIQIYSMRFHELPRGKQDKEYDSYLGLGELLWQLYKAKRKERYEYCDEL